MLESFLPLHFPKASNMMLIGVAVGLLVVFWGAIGIGYLRNVWRRRRNVRAEWALIRDMVKERELSDRHRDVLMAMLRRYARREPLHAVTMRQQFDLCVDGLMKDYEQRGDVVQSQEMGRLLREIRAKLELDYVGFGHSIQSTRQLRSGQIVWFAGATGAPVWAMGIVASVDEAYFRVALKENRNLGAGIVHPGEDALFRLWREDDGRYQFKTQLVQGPAGNPPVWSFRHIGALARVQERCHYRVHCNVDTSLERLTQSDDPNLPVIMNARVCSLSAGGFAALVQYSLPRETLVRLPLHLTALPAVSVDARVLGNQTVGAGRYLVRGHFVATAPEDLRQAQEVIARYVALRQQPMREKRAREML